MQKNQINILNSNLVDYNDFEKYKINIANNNDSNNIK